MATTFALRMFFLGRALCHGEAGFYKLSLFRRGKGRFECRLKDQDASMADMEVHEHIVVDGKSARLKNPLMHHNVESLSRYIQKHNEYSNWEARVWLQGEANSVELPPSLFGTQAQRRRWLRKVFFGIPGSPVLYFLLQVFLAPWVSGRRARPDLLRVSGHPILSHQSQNLRVAEGLKPIHVRN